MKSSKTHKKKLLILVSRFPYPLEKGDKLRAFHQLRSLSAHFDITLMALTDRDISAAHRSKVEAHCEQVIIHRQRFFQKWFQAFVAFVEGKPIQTGYFLVPKAKRQIKQFIREGKYDHVYCQLVRMSEYVKDEHSVPKTLDYMDAFSAGIFRRISQQPLWKRWVFKLEAKRLNQYEGLMFDFFEEKTIISEQDRNLIRHPESEKIHCIPNGIDESFFEKLDIEKSHDFVFVGNMSYPPNVEAVHYIHEHILPAFPESQLLISGSSPSSRVKKLAAASSQITLTGWVDDIRESYCRGKIFLAPMMIGTGMQNKLLEAMALGVPCITTPLANNAIRGKHEKHVLVASTPEEFRETIKRLQTSPDLVNQLSENAQSFVREAYSWEKITEKLAGIMIK